MTSRSTCDFTVLVNPSILWLPLVSSRVPRTGGYLVRERHQEETPNITLHNRDPVVLLRYRSGGNAFQPMGPDRSRRARGQGDILHRELSDNCIDKKYQ